MITLVIDSTELLRDPLLRGATFQLLGYLTLNGEVGAFVPAPAFEELVEGRARKVLETQARLTVARASAVNLGLDVPVATDVIPDYRAYALEALTERIGARLLPWPTVPHEHLVMRATKRMPPFDEKGGGYRDSLIWFSALELVSEGKEVVLASSDHAFANSDGSLSASLADEARNLGGGAHLTSDLRRWLVEVSPWRVDDVVDALSAARDEDLGTYLLQSDFLSELEPEAKELGLPALGHGYFLDFTECRWLADLDARTRSKLPGGAEAVEYALTFELDFEARLPANSVPQEWHDAVVRISIDGAELDGVLEATLLILVLFDVDSDFSIDSLKWEPIDVLDRLPASREYHPGQLHFDFDGHDG